MRTRLALSLLAAWTLLAALPALASAAQIVVTRAPGLDAAQRADVRADAGVTLDRSVAGSEVVLVPAAREDRALAELNADPRVRSAAPNVAVHAASDPPTDPYYAMGDQWYLENDGSFTASARPDADIDAQAAWDSGATGSGVDVAVVDTQIYTQHSDLVHQVDTPADPQDFVLNPCSKYSVPTPDHGTAVAGVIAAEHNTTGIAGIAPQAKIVPVHALDNCGDGSLASVIPALNYAADHAPIVVAAFATPPGLSPDEQADVAQQFDTVFSGHTNTLFVVPSGNEANDDDVNPVYPCDSTASNLICVGMSDVNDQPDCLGNVGQTSVDLFAPGQGIETTVRGAQFGVATLSGTSMAAPMVAGVAALVESTWTSGPGDSADALAGALRTKPRDPDPTVPGDTGVPGDVDPHAAMAQLSVSGGRLNAAKALGLVPTDQPAEPSNWAPCDDDHDGFRNSVDQCPQPGPVNGCPDSDGDGVADGHDNCPDVANVGQANADGDNFGDACDSTPRGADADGDGVGALDDQCPTQAGPASNHGCPLPVTATPTPPPPPVVTPTPTPPPVVITPVVPLRIDSVAVTVAHNRKTARVTVRLTRTASTNVTVEQRVKRGHRHVWKRVTRRSFTATAGGRAMTVRTGKRGSYRVTVVLAGAKTVRRDFRV